MHLHRWQTPSGLGRWVLTDIYDRWLSTDRWGTAKADALRHTAYGRVPPSLPADASSRSTDCLNDHRFGHEDEDARVVAAASGAIIDWPATPTEPATKLSGRVWHPPP